MKREQPKHKNSASEKRGGGRNLSIAEVEIPARCIVGGRRRGEVLFSSEPIAFLQGVDPELGCVSDRKHQIHGVPFSNKILVFPNSVGSSVGAYVIYRLKKIGNAPKAMINQSSDIITASGCALAGIPLFDLCPGKLIEELRDAKRILLDEAKSKIIVEARGSFG